MHVRRFQSGVTYVIGFVAFEWSIWTIYIFKICIRPVCVFLELRLRFIIRPASRLPSLCINSFIILLYFLQVAGFNYYKFLSLHVMPLHHECHFSGEYLEHISILIIPLIHNHQSSPPEKCNARHTNICFIFAPVNHNSRLNWSPSSL